MVAPRSPEGRRGDVLWRGLDGLEQVLVGITIVLTRDTVLDSPHVVEQHPKELLFLHVRVTGEAKIFGDPLHPALAAVLEEGIHPVFGDVVGIRHGRVIGWKSKGRHPTRRQPVSR